MTEESSRPYILVGTDGSPQALRAVTWAADEAGRRKLSLMIVHVADTRRYAAADGGFGMTTVEAEALANEVLSAAELRVEKWHPEVRTSRVVVVGTPLVELIERSGAAELAVVGASGLGGFSSMLLGSVAMGLVTSGHSPVAVIRGDTESGVVPRTGPVVLGIDGMECSEKAISWAFDEASRRGTTLTAVHVWAAYPTVNARAYAMSIGVDLRAEEVEHQELLAERLAGWQEKYPEVSVRRIVESGTAADTILRHTSDAQLVVVGSRGHGDVTGVFFGSVSRILVHRAPCPVLIARHREV